MEINKKAGLQLIQTVTFPTGDDFASATFNIDWTQWSEVYMVFHLEYQGSLQSYDLYFLPNSYIVERFNASDVGAIFYSIFNENRSVEGVTFTGEGINGNQPYKNITEIALSLIGSTISTGTIVQFYGRK